MSQTDASTLETRQRLLESAGAVFAEQGFRNATVRDICERARANVAAVNYHFGDKERLYAEVLRYAFRYALEKYPPDLGLAVDATPEQRLAAFVRAFLLRILEHGRVSWAGKLMSREMSDPTPALDMVVDEAVGPQFARLKEIVRDLIGGAQLDEQTLRLCGRSVVAQCIFYHHAQHVLARLHPEQKYDPGDIEQIAAHIARFSLAGIRAVGGSRS